MGQLFIAERVTELDDIILNTLGGTLGALLGILYLNISAVTPLSQDN
jgi:glycopeptide antibiotics resistance protein